MRLPANLTEEFQEEWADQVDIMHREVARQGEMLVVRDLVTSELYEVYLLNEGQPEVREALEIRVDIMSGLGAFSAHRPSRFSRAWCCTFEVLNDIDNQQFSNRTIALFWCNLVKDLSVVRSEGVGVNGVFGPHQLGTTRAGELKMAGYFLFSRLTEENLAEANTRTIRGMRSILGHLLTQNSTQGQAPEARWLRNMGQSPVSSLSELTVVADAVRQTAERWART